MARFILAIIAFAIAVAVLKMVILALIIAGLIFRPLQTIGLLGVFGLLALIRAQPILGLGVTALFIVVAVMTKKKEAAGKEPALSENTDEPDPA